MAGQSTEIFVELASTRAAPTPTPRNYSIARVLPESGPDANSAPAELFRQRRHINEQRRSLAINLLVGKVRGKNPARIPTV